MLSDDVRKGKGRTALPPTHRLRIYDPGACCETPVAGETPDYVSGETPAARQPGLRHQTNNSRAPDATSEGARRSKDATGLPSDLMAIIVRTSPRKGERVAERVWHLARSLAAVTGLDGRLLPKIVREWVRRSEQRERLSPDVPPLTRQLRAALYHVRAPWGREFAKRIHEARAMPCPEVAEPYRGKPKLELLARLAVVLERRACGKPWPLSARLAAEGLGVSRATANRWLNRLASDGVIVMDEPGRRGPASRQATTWRLGT